MSIEEGLVERVAELTRERDAAVARAEKAEQCLNLITAGEIEVKDEQNAKRIAYLERRLAAADALANVAEGLVDDLQLRRLPTIMLGEALRAYQAARSGREEANDGRS